jgi:hypothetical protein
VRESSAKALRFPDRVAEPDMDVEYCAEDNGSRFASERSSARGICAHKAALLQQWPIISQTRRFTALSLAYNIFPLFPLTSIETYIYTLYIWRISMSVKYAMLGIGGKGPARV